MKYSPNPTRLRKVPIIQIHAMRITLSPDGNKIFVAACSDGPNLSYNREPFSAMGKIKCNTLLDNLELDTEGTL